MVYRWIGPVIKFIKSKVDLISSSKIYLIDDAKTSSPNHHQKFQVPKRRWCWIPLHNPYPYSLQRCFGFLHFRYLKCLVKSHLNHHFVPFFLAQCVFGTPKKYLPVIQLPGVTPAEARCSKKKTVEEIVG